VQHTADHVIVIPANPEIPMRLIDVNVFPIDAATLTEVVGGNAATHLTGHYTDRGPVMALYRSEPDEDHDGNLRATRMLHEADLGLTVFGSAVLVCVGDDGEFGGWPSPAAQEYLSALSELLDTAMV
jgi:hypothetical protein